MRSRGLLAGRWNWEFGSWVTVPKGLSGNGGFLAALIRTGRLFSAGGGALTSALALAVGLRTGTWAELRGK